MNLQANLPAVAYLGWSTATDHLSATRYAAEISTLGEHLGTCQRKHPRLVALHCLGDSMRGFVATRLVTTLVLALSLVSLLVWLV